MNELPDIRKDFSILAEKIYNKPLVYFDNGATTQKPQVVIDKITELYRHKNANIHRGDSFWASQLTEEYENTRSAVARFINAEVPEEIVFTSGTTDSLNMVAHAWARENLRSGDEIIISEAEHHANIVPWQMVCEQYGASLKVLPVNNNGEWRLSALSDLISPKTKLLSLTHAGNVLGLVNPIKEVAKIARQHSIITVIDAAQTVPHTRIDVQDLGIDFLAFSAHKMYAPTGVGVLYGKKQRLEELPPYRGGGEMIETVTFEKTIFADLPHKHEAGTPNYIDIIAFGEAIAYLNRQNIDTIGKHEKELTQYAYDRLSEIEGCIIYGKKEDRVSLITFNIKGLHPFDIGKYCDMYGITLRTGHLCAQPILRRFGTEYAVRISFGMYNTKEEIDFFISILKKGIERLM